MNEIEMTMNDMIISRGILEYYERTRKQWKKSWSKKRRHIRDNYNKILNNNSIVIF